METVKEYLEWKYNKNEKSVEEKFSDEIRKLEWDETDTLYSLLGIYVIGLGIYYPKQFTYTNFQIRTERGSDAYSKDIFNYYKEFVELNEDLEDFIKNYLKIGNLIPIWPGGNKHKGFSKCFDIPEIYFTKHKKFTDCLVQVYKNAYMENIIENKKQIDLHKLFKMNKKQYKEFLKYIVDTIQNRDNKIMDVLALKEKKIKKT